MDLPRLRYDWKSRSGQVQSDQCGDACQRVLVFVEGSLNRERISATNPKTNTAPVPEGTGAMFGHPLLPHYSRLKTYVFHIDLR